MNDEAIEKTIETIRDWQKKYTTDHIRCNIVKYFIMDGSIKLGDILTVEPFSSDPEGKDCDTGCHCNVAEMTKLMALARSGGRHSQASLPSVKIR